MLLHVRHETLYHYTPAVENAQHAVHLRPSHSPSQTVLQHALQISPEPAQQHELIDGYGNSKLFFSFQSSHEQLQVIADSVVQTQPGAQQSESLAWERVRDAFRYRAGAAYSSAWEFAFASPYVPRHEAFAEFAKPSFTPGRPLLEAAHDLMSRIHSAMAYDGDSTDVDTPALAALQQRKGVCQDFAHIMVACCRAMGLPARYVSGYLLTQPAAGQPRLIGCDASHAWASVYCPSSPDQASQTVQWFDFDPTNNRAPGEDYVTLATGRDFLDVSPLRGVIRGGAQHTLDVAVTVTPMHSPEQPLTQSV
jgi:transglutaminase-like putative cysteine protease